MYSTPMPRLRPHKRKRVHAYLGALGASLDTLEPGSALHRYVLFHAAPHLVVAERPDWAEQVLGSLDFFVSIHDEDGGSSALRRQWVLMGSNDLGCHGYLEEILEYQERAPRDWMLYDALDSLSMYAWHADMVSVMRPCLVELQVLTGELVGEDDALYADILNRRVLLAQQEGEFEQSIELGEQALTIIRRTLGEHHPNVGVSMVNLGRSFTRLGNTDRAIELIEAGIAIEAAEFGAESAEVCSSRDGLGIALKESGNHQAYIDLTEETYRIRRAVLPRGHIDLVVSCWTLGWIRMKQGDPVEAEALFAEAHAIERAEYGDSNASVAEKLEAMAMAIGAQGRPDEALALIQQSIESRSTGSDHFAHRTVTAYCNLAHGLLSFDCAREALELLCEAEKLELGDDTLSVAAAEDLLYRFASVHLRLDDATAALSYFERLRELEMQSRSDDDADTASTLKGIGECLITLGRAEEAGPYLRQASAVWESCPGEEESVKEVNELLAEMNAD